MNGATTGFWHDISGARGCIDLEIHNHATVDMVLQTHRPRRHKLEKYNIVESVIEEQRRKSITQEEDVVLWKQKKKGIIFIRTLSPRKLGN